MRNSMIGACVFLFGATSTAHGQMDLFSAETISGYADLRLYSANGEDHWTDHGLGKARYGDQGLGIDLAEAGLVWRPRLSWSVSGYAHLQFNDDQDTSVGVTEAFLRYKPVPRSEWRWSGRAGIFYPPVSLEHREEAWATRFTLTPSAINSWIGEEIKGAGIEATVRREIAGQEIGLTGGAFVYNDTTGVLISYRGWALHDLKTAQGSAYAITVYPGHIAVARPFDEADSTLGYYLRADWSPVPGININAIAWDNRADPLSRDGDNRAWATQFVNLGLEVEISEELRVLSQVLTGTTASGAVQPGGRRYLDFSYYAAYAMLLNERGDHTFAVRGDVFDVDDRSASHTHEFGERGWSGLASWRWARQAHQTLSAELLHVESDRALRARWGIGASHSQTQLQFAIRHGF